MTDETTARMTGEVIEADGALEAPVGDLAAPPLGYEQLDAAREGRDDACGRPRLGPADAIGALDDRAPFDYAKLDAAQRDRAIRARDRIRAAMRRSVADVLEIGRELLTVRPELKGHFTAWHATELGMSTSSASRYMQVARRFGGRTSQIGKLEPSLLYELAAPSTPDEAVYQALMRAEGGEPLDVKEVRELIADAKVARRERERVAARDEALADGAEVPEPRLPPSIIVRQADALRLPLPDGTADLVLTSPPYGVGKAYKGYGDEATAWPAYLQDALAEARRCTGERGRLALNVPLDTTKGGYRPTYAQAVEAAIAAGWKYRFSIVWLEDNISKTTARGSVDSPLAPHVIAPCEMIAVFSNGEWGQIAQPGLVTDLTHEEWLEWTSGVWAIPGESRPWEDFPAAMPEQLAERLIKLLSFVGDTVLDPFSGSGTTALVGARLKRDVACFDIDDGQVASIKRRLQRAVADGLVNFGLGVAP